MYIECGIHIVEHLIIELIKQIAIELDTLNPRMEFVLLEWIRSFHLNLQRQGGIQL